MSEQVALLLAAADVAETKEGLVSGVEVAQWLRAFARQEASWDLSCRDGKPVTP